MTFRKLIPSLLLGLLVCHVLGQTLLTLWGDWATRHRLHQTVEVEERLSELVVKMPFSLPYASDFEKITSETKYAIFQEQYFQEQKQVYANDTLYIHYQPVSTSRENVFSMLSDAVKTIEANQSDNNTAPMKSARALFKSLAKEYHTQQLRLQTFLWVSYLPQAPFIYQSFFSKIAIQVESPPPRA